MLGYTRVGSFCNLVMFMGYLSRGCLEALGNIFHLSDRKIPLSTLQQTCFSLFTFKD